MFSFSLKSVFFFLNCFAIIYVFEQVYWSRLSNLIKSLIFLIFIKTFASFLAYLVTHAHVPSLIVFILKRINTRWAGVTVQAAILLSKSDLKLFCSRTTALV